MTEKIMRLKNLADTMLENAEIPAMIAPILQVTITTNLQKLENDEQVEAMLRKAKELIEYVETGEIKKIEQETDYHTAE